MRSGRPPLTQCGAGTAGARHGDGGGEEWRSLSLLPDGGGLGGRGNSLSPLLVGVVSFGKGGLRRKGCSFVCSVRDATDRGAFNKRTEATVRSVVGLLADAPRFGTPRRFSPARGRRARALTRPPKLPPSPSCLSEHYSSTVPLFRPAPRINKGQPLLQATPHSAFEKKDRQTTPLSRERERSVLFFHAPHDGAPARVLPGRGARGAAGRRDDV